jgi:peptidoglycan/xylan/chitin deacetylase (PgdA/CDA1 family)
MTGDMRYHEVMLAHRDWLLGRNPWGTSMFTGIPEGGEFPEDVHLPIVQILKKQVPGGLVDGPIAAKTYQSLRGLRLNQPDEFAEFQTTEIVYHDDVGDYSTNEPTMDGTADAILMLALLGQREPTRRKTRVRVPSDRFVFEQGAIIRGDRNARRLALVFTGDEFADGAATITETLKRRGLHASFFLTGRFYRNPKFQTAIQRLKGDGHYLGPHSDEHLLYCDWESREQLLVTREQFEQDLNRNYASMRLFGIKKSGARFFLPPFEWYNQKISDWTASLGLQLINFTSGTRSHADFTTPAMKNYLSSASIMESIRQYEARDPNGLNGFILLSHIGVAPERQDKFYEHLGELLDWLESRGYRSVRIDELLNGPE